MSFTSINVYFIAVLVYVRYIRRGTACRAPTPWDITSSCHAWIIIANSGIIADTTPQTLYLHVPAFDKLVHSLKQ